MVKAFTVIIYVGVVLVASANAVTYTSYGISDLDCVDVARIVGIDFAWAGDNDDASHLVMGVDGDLYINIDGSLTIPRDLPRGAERNDEMDESDMSEFTGRPNIFLVVGSDDGFFGFGFDAETPLDLNDLRKRGVDTFTLTHLVPISAAAGGFDDSRSAVTLSVPITVSVASNAYLFAGYNVVALFVNNALDLPQFSVVDLLTGEVSVVATFLQIEDQVCNTNEGIATGVYEKTEDSFTLLCATSDGIVRLSNTGNKAGYAWGPFEMDIDQHDVAADWFRPENGTFYLTSKGYSSSDAVFGDAYRPDASNVAISCKATYTMVEESGDGGDGQSGDDGDGDAASSFSASFLWDINLLYHLV